MVAVVSGNSLGLDLSSLATLGAQGTRGAPGQGSNKQLSYVNVATGNLILQNRDSVLVGVGLDVIANRTYNSQGQLKDDNNDAWTIGLYKSAKLTGGPNKAGSQIVRTDGDGSSAVYTFNTTRGLYLNTDGAGAYDTFTVTGQRVLTWTDGATGVTEVYDGRGLGTLLSTRDTSGNTVRYSYQPNGLLVSVINDRNGARSEGTFFDYAPGKDLTRIRTTVIGEDGRTLKTVTDTRYTYTSDHRLSSVTVDLSPNDNSIGDGRVYTTRYSYDGSSNRITSMTEDDGTSLRFTYTQVGASWRVASSTDGLGRITTYRYDTAARSTRVTDALGQTTVFDYDSLGQMTRITSPSLGAAGGTITRRFSYNSNGDVTRVIDGEGHAVDYLYDVNGNQIKQRDQAGNTITRLYNAQNRLISETTMLVPDPDGAGALLPQGPLTRRLVYDKATGSLLRFDLSAEGRVTENRYDSAGQRIATIQYSGNVYPVAGLATNAVPSEAQLTTWVAGSIDRSAAQRTDLVYDFRGELQRTTTYARTSALGEGVLDGTEARTEYVYDSRGQLLKTINPRASVTLFAYDGLGRLLAQTDALGNTTNTVFDDAGHRSTLTQANGLSIVSSYDQGGNLTSVAQTNPAGLALGTTRYFYDANHQLRMSEDATGVRNWLIYDVTGRRVGQVDGNGTLTETEYNLDDQVKRSIVYAHAIDTRQLVGATGLPVVISIDALRPQASADDQQNWMFYDAADRLIKQVDAAGAVTETMYDGASRVLAVMAYANTFNPASITSTSKASDITVVADALRDRVSRNFYDADGLRIATLDGEGGLTRIKYDAAGREIQRALRATPVTPALRATGTLTQITPAASADDMVSARWYNDRSELIAQIDGEGRVTRYQYDNTGNLVTTTRHAQSLAPLREADPLGDTPPTITSDTTDQITRRSYDALNRLVQETDISGVVTRYSYDVMSRLLSTTRALGSDEARTTQQASDLQGRLISETSGEGQTAWVHRYDAAGRRVSSTDAVGNTTLYFYDADGQRVASINAAGEITREFYNDLNQRIAISQYEQRLAATQLAALTGGLMSAALAGRLDALAGDASRTNLRYNTTGTLAERSDALGQTTRYIYNAFGEEAVCIKPIATNRTMVELRQYDRRGLLTQVTADADPLGINAATRSVYDAFGRIVSTSDANGQIRTKQYDRVGRVVSLTDALGARQTTSYDAFDRVLVHSDALGRQTRWSYDDVARSMTMTSAEGFSVTTRLNRHGQTQSITDANGHTQTTRYDRNGKVIEITNALATVANQYDAANRLIASTDANGTNTTLHYDAANRVLERTVDPTGLALTTRYAYDAKGRQVSIIEADGLATDIVFDLSGQVISRVVDAAGLKLTTAMTWDAQGRTLSVSDANGVVTAFVYDALGRRSAEHLDPTGLNLTRNYRYDANGNLLSASDANGAITRYGYDAENRLVFTVNADGEVRRQTYDAAGQLIESRAFAQAIATSEVDTSDDASLAALIARLVEAPQHDEVSTRIYDLNGRIAYQLDGSGGLTRNQHDGNGNLIRQSRFAQALPAGSALTRAGLDETVATLADAQHDHDQRFIYDALNRLSYSLQALNATQLAVTAYTYDANGNQTSTIAYASAIDAALADTDLQAALSTAADAAHDRRSVSIFDSAGRMVWSIDGRGVVTGLEHDAVGRLISTRVYSVALADTTNLPHTQSALLEVLQPDPLRDATEKRFYDSAGRLSRTEDSTGVVQHTLVDAAGRIVASIDGDGSLTEFRLDAAARVTRTLRYATPVPVANGNAATLDLLRSSADGASNTTLNSWSVYDAAGRLMRSIDGTGAVVEMTYDASARLVTTLARATRIDIAQLGDRPTLADVDADQTSAANDDRLSRYFHDGSGRLVALIDAAGTLTEIRHNASGQEIERLVHALPVSANTSGHAPLVAPHADDQITSTVRDALGQVLVIVDAEQFATRIDHDATGRVLTSTRFATRLNARPSAALSLSAEQPVTTTQDQTTTYRYDALGREVLSTDHQGTQSTTSYDAAGSVVSITQAAASSDARTTQRRYDAFGRLVAELDGEGAAQAASGQAADIAAAWSSHAIAHSYDSAGRRTSTTDALGHRTVFYYDRDSRLVATINAAGEVQAMQYNALNQLVASIDFGTRLTAPEALTGGLIDSTLEARLASLADARIDRVTRSTYSADNRIATRSDALGHITRFELNAFGEEIALRSPAGQGAEVLQTSTYNQRGQRIETIADALGVHAVTSLRYDAFGRVIARTDANGNVRSTEYDRLGRQITDIDATGALTHTSYDAFARVIAHTDATGHTTVTQYDATRRSTTVTTAEGISTMRLLNRNGQTIRLDDGRGNSTVYRYDRNGNLTSTNTGLTTSTNRYDSANRVIETRDANGVSIRTVYDAVDRVLTRVLDPDGLALTTQTRYDAFGQKIETLDAAGVITRTSFDANGHVLTRSIDPDGLNQVSRTSFDTAGNIVTFSDAAGLVSVYEYDGLGRRLSETRDPAGLALTTRYRYDAAGNMVARIDAAGHITRYVYDANNRRVYTIDTLGQVEASGYDAAGRVTSTRAYGHTIDPTLLDDATPPAEVLDLLSADANDRRQFLIYDQDGRQRFAIDGAGAISESRYDANGNVIERIAYATAGQFVFGPLAGTANTEFLAISSHRLPLNAAQSVRMLDLSRADPAALSTALVLIADAQHDVHQRTVYDVLNRAIWSVDGLGAVRQRLLDGNGNVRRETRYANPIAANADPSSVVSSARDRISSSYYDAANRQVLSVDATGAVTEQVFDAQGKVVARTAYATPLNLVDPIAAGLTLADVRARLRPDADHDRITRSVRDTLGREVLVVDAEGAVTATAYDAAGNAVRSTRYAQALTSAMPLVQNAVDLNALLRSDPAHDRITQRGFDAAQRLVSEIDAEGSVISHRYDALGQIVATTAYAQRLSGTDLSALVTDAEHDQTVTWAYDQAQHLITATDAQGASETTTWDALGRKASYTDKNGNLWTYAYDAAGHLISETAPAVAIARIVLDSRGLLSAADPILLAPVTLMRYDALGNLVERTEAAGQPEQRVTRYEYDAAGHQVRMIYPTVQVYDGASDPLTDEGGLAPRHETTLTPTVEVRYDSFGDAVRNTDVVGAVSRKIYDRLGQVRYEIDALGYLTTYNRDAFGQAVQMTRYAQALTAAQLSAIDAAAGDAVPLPTSELDRLLTSRYDRAGRVVEVIEPRSFVYDASATAGQEYFVGNATTRTSYDVFGHQLEVAKLDNPLTDRWSRNSTHYDRNGRQIAHIDVLAYLSTQSYDAFGNLQSETQYAKALIGWDRNATTLPTPFTSADDRTTTLAYDRNNRKVSETRLNVEVTDDAHLGAQRIDLVTRYGYDAVGNQTRLTHSSGASMFTYYDAQNRTRAVAAPPLADSDGQARAPITALQRDVYGNIVVQTEYAQGASGADEHGYTVAASANDRITLTQNDNNGHALQIRQADGVALYRSYDARGKLRKEWQAVSDANAPGTLHTIYHVVDYDLLGRQVRLTTPGPTSGRVTEEKIYNAFGEVVRNVSNGSNGGAQEFFDYDNTGHLWRTNQGDGIIKVSLFDLQGRATADLRSAGAGNGDIDLSGLQSARDALGLELRRTDMRYDALGRVVARFDPSHSVTLGAVALRSLTLESAVRGTAELQVNNDGARLWNGDNQVQVAWTSLANLGNGDIRVTVSYQTRSIVLPITTGGAAQSATPVAAEVTRVYSADEASEGALLSWTDADGAQDGGIAHIDRIVVSKKDRYGAWQIVSQRDFDRDPGLMPTAPRVIDLITSNDGSGTASLQIKPLSSNPANDVWTSVLVTDFGDALRFTVGQLPNGSYAYRVLTPVAGSEPVVSASGQFTLGTALPGISIDSSSPGLLNWTAPAADITEQWRYRLAGSNGAWTVQQAVVKQGQHQVAVHLLAEGQYEYQLNWLDAASSTLRAQNTGHFSVQAAQAAQQVGTSGMPTIDGLVGGDGLIGGALSDHLQDDYFVWQTPSAEFEQTFEVRIEGGDWALQDISALPGGMSGIDRRNLLAFALYDYRLTVTRSGTSASSIYGGTLDLSDVSRLPARFAYARAASGAIIGARNAPVVSWPAPMTGVVAHFEISRVGVDGITQNWIAAPLDLDVIGVNADGPVGQQKADLSNFGPGDYAFELYFTQAGSATTVAHATGRLTLQSSGEADALGRMLPPLLVSFAITTPPYVPGHTQAGQVAAVELTPKSAIASTTLAVDTSPATRLVGSMVEQKLDRWNNVIEVSDARSINWKTQYRYNADNKLIVEIKPDGNGGISQSSPTTRYTYDRFGQQTGKIDANGNLSAWRYDNAGQQSREEHADGGVVSYRYDLLGNRVALTDALGNVTRYRYDALGRLLGIDGGSAATYTVDGGNNLVNLGTRDLTVSYRYDEAGRKISITNADGSVVRMAYDLAGNLIQTVQPMGQQTRSVYDHKQRKISETDANGATATWSYDHFGQLLSHTDLGGTVYTYRYDNARQQIGQTSTRGQNIERRYDASGRLIETNDHTLHQVTSYAYDLAGNRIHEKTVQDGVVYQNNRIAYDTLGRMRDVSDAWAHISIDYDKLGNRTRILSTSTIGNTAQNVERWFAYDSMNRQVVVDGVDAAGNLGANGKRLRYDLNGNRSAMEFQGNVQVNGTWGKGSSTETYAYDALNRLVSVQRDGRLLDQRYYDAAGRVVQNGPQGALSKADADHLNAGIAEKDHIGDETHIRRYDANGNLLFDRVLRSDNVAKTDMAYTQYDGVGNALRYTVTNHDGDRYTNTFSTQYARFDSYQQAQINGSSSLLQPGATTFGYDSNGFMVSVDDHTKNANDRQFINDASGRVLAVKQGGNVERQLIVNGEVLGRHGVGLDPVKARSDEGDPRFTALTDLDFSFNPVSGNYPGTMPVTRVVGAGETLQSIAQNVYGDANLWYRVAQANGLSSNDDLRVGDRITVPNGISTVHNQADTYKVYDPSRVVGDTSPNLPPPPPPPPPDDGCGVLAIIVIIIVAVAVTIVTAGAGAALAGATLSAGGGLLGTGAAIMAGTAVAGVGMWTAIGIAFVAAAVGSIVSQGVAMMMGVQEEFSWSQVGMSALAAGAGAGLGAYANGAGKATFLAGPSTPSVASRAVLANAATQQVGVTLGMQEQFSWRGVAAAGVGAAIGNALNHAMTGTPTLDSAGNTVTQENSLSTFLKDNVGRGDLARLTMGTIAGLGAGIGASVVGAGRWELQQVAADAFGNALANTLSERVMAVEREHIAEAAQVQAARNKLYADWDQFRPGELTMSLDLSSNLASAGDTPDDMLLDLNEPSALQSRKVKSGDSFWTIAKEQLGPGASRSDIERQSMALMQENPGVDPRKMRVGHELNLVAPGGGAGIDNDTVSRYRQSDQALRQYRDLQQQTEVALLIDRLPAPGAGPAGTPRASPTLESPLAEDSRPALVQKFQNASDRLRVGPGFVSQQYDRAVQGYSDPNASYLDRAGNFIAAAAMAPAFLAEELGRGVLNIPSDFAGAVPHAYDAKRATNIAMNSSLPTDVRFSAALSATGDTASAILGAAGPLVFIEAALARTAAGAASSGLRSSAVISAERAEIGANSGKGLVQTLDPTTTSFTQSWVDGKKLGGLVESMETKGWAGKPIDTVMMKSGTIASIDNTRLLAARLTGTNPEANVWRFNDLITNPVRQATLQVNGVVPKTWGEAAQLRINSPLQNQGIPGWSQKFPNGSIYDPLIK